jgi:hypothetical protein
MGEDMAKESPQKLLQRTQKNHKEKWIGPDRPFFSSLLD